MSDEVAVYSGGALTVQDLQGQVILIQEVMAAVMKDKEHYGTIPGCGDKKSLFKPGAEKLIMTFKLVPEIDVEVVDMPNAHREYRTKVTMFNFDGVKLGTGVGSCSTMEGKYRFRTGEKTVTDKPVPQAYWNLRKTDQKAAQALIGKGNSTKKVDGNWFITAGGGDKVEHDNPADYYNTCLKMSKKRAVVDAVLTVTAASDIFTQDIEDMPEVIKGAAQVAESKPSLEEEVVEAEIEDVPAEPQPELMGHNPMGCEPPDSKGDIETKEVKRIFAKLHAIGVSDTLAQHEVVSEILGFEPTLPSMNYMSAAQGDMVVKELIKREKAQG